MDEKLKILYECMEEAVVKNFEDVFEKKKEKHKIPKPIKKLFQKKTKISKHIKRTKCKYKLIKLRKQLDEIDLKLIENKEKHRF